MKNGRRMIDSFAKFESKKILVVGDLMLDVYLTGQSTRLCPEAPVPLVDIAERHVTLGGSANVVCNFKSLGAHVDIASVIGDDVYAEEAMKELKARGIPTRFILRDPTRKTMVKTRIIAGGHIVTRFDQGCTHDIHEPMATHLARTIKQNYHHYDAIIVSDYGKGTITKQVIETLGNIERQSGLFIGIDSKRLTAFKSIRPTFVKPNYYEAAQMLAIEPTLNDRIARIKRAGKDLAAMTNAEIAAVTMDAEGSMIFEQGEFVSHIPAQNIPNAHVSGAGDTYLAAFTLSVIAGLDLTFSAKVATVASSLVISQETTSTCSLQELILHFTDSKIIADKEDLSRLCEDLRKAGKKIVFTNGCFDILHSGHVSYLQAAKEFGDVLIVGVNTDESIRRIKGETRPINTLLDRMQVLSGLASINYLVSFGSKTDDTPISVLKIVKPDIFVKGGDYTREQLPEAATIEENGGTIRFVPQIPNRSTTAIVRKISSQKSKPFFRRSHEQLERL